MQRNTITKDKESKNANEQHLNDSKITQEKIELEKKLELTDRQLTIIHSNAKRAFEKANEDSKNAAVNFDKASQALDLANRKYLDKEGRYQGKFRVFKARDSEKRRAQRNKLERTFSAKKQKALMVLILLGFAACCSGIGFIIGIPTLALGIAGFLLIVGSLTSLTLSFAGAGYLDKKLSEDSKLQDMLNECLRLHTKSKTAMHEAKDAFNKAKNLKKIAEDNKIRATIVKETADKQLEMARQSLDDVQKNMTLDNSIRMPVPNEKAGHYSSTAGLLFYGPASRDNKPSDDKYAGAKPSSCATPGW